MALAFTERHIAAPDKPEAIRSTSDRGGTPFDKAVNSR
jgi:hypothetical protein